MSENISELTLIENSKILGVQSDIDIARIKQTLAYSMALCPEPLKSSFISNYLESDGKSQIKDIWFFSDNYVVESLNFLREPMPKLEITIMRQNISSCSFKAENYDISQEPKDNSVLAITPLMWSTFSCEFIASGKNCKNLLNIFNLYVKANLVRSWSRNASLLQ